ncbi:MAG TPA: hypothetical protein VEQ10_09980 [Vicinamibacteria bacterium]|nr:hypothetical protein [Vicinamibacteria bacterium]
MEPGTTDPKAGTAPHVAPPLSVPLRAGPLRLVFDRGWLRWIRLGEREVLHGIYAAVRETGWATVPAEIEDLELDADADRFHVRFVARHRQGAVRLDWDARIEGSREGRIVYAIDGRAGSTFLRNRIGFCVLHPLSCAGEPCTLETVDGRRQGAVFPRLVSPHQPFFDLRAIAYQPLAGVTAEVRMEGDTFETEDQRNWSDASFKTYCPPLALPYPTEIRQGTRVAQTVTLALTGEVRQAVMTVPGALPRKRNSPAPAVLAVDARRPLPRPALGIGGAGLVSLDQAQAALVRALRLDHLRADLQLDAPGWEEALSRAADNAERVGAALELALFLPEPPLPALRALAARASPLTLRVSHWRVFRAHDLATHEGDAAAAREILGPVDPHARFAGGVDRYFTELNRQRPPLAGLDQLGFSLNPQVHAFDDATLFENLDSLEWTATTARDFAPGLPLAVTPVTLRPRSEPQPDPRQLGPVAAAWTVLFLGRAAAAGYASLGFFELVGPRGVMEGARPYPVYHAFAAVAQMREAAVLPVVSRRPERVQALALREGGHTRVFLANVSGETHPVRVDGLAGAARSAPIGSEAAEPCGFELVLPPRAITRLDVRA